jgi:hypothetical protein
MAIAYRLDHALGLTLVVWDGAVSGDDAEDHVRSLFDDDEWPPGRLHLLDATTATQVPIVANTKLVDLAANAAQTKRVRFAVVQNMGFEEATYFEREAAARGLSQVIVFNDLVTACTWLGLDGPSIRTTIAEMRRELREQG